MYPARRYLAALVPLAITAQFFMVGTGLMKDEAAVAALSRTGDRREILQGPLFYGIIFVLITIFYWYDSPIGITALMALCGGDGLADVLGRRLGEGKITLGTGKKLGRLIGDVRRQLAANRGDLCDPLRLQVWADSP